MYQKVVASDGPYENNSARTTANRRPQKGSIFGDCWAYMVMVKMCVNGIHCSKKYVKIERVCKQRTTLRNICLVENLAMSLQREHQYAAPLVIVNHRNICRKRRQKWNAGQPVLDWPKRASMMQLTTERDTHTKSATTQKRN